MRTKPLFAVHYNGRMQPVKAVDEAEAKRKFLKRFSRLSEEDIVEVCLIEEGHKHMRIFKQSAI